MLKFKILILFNFNNTENKILECWLEENVSPGISSRETMLYICTNHIHLNNDMFLCFSLKRNNLKH